MRHRNLNGGSASLVQAKSFNQLLIEGLISGPYSPPQGANDQGDSLMILLWRKNFALTITLLYAIGGCAWIVMSDHLLAQIVDRGI